MTELLYSNIFHVLNLEKSTLEMIYKGRYFEEMSIVTKAKEDAGDWRDRKQGECNEAKSR